MNIIGVTGQIGHGKSTFARLVGECAFSYQQFESGQVVTEVANAWQAATKMPPQPTQAGLNNWISLLPPIMWDIVHAETDKTLLQFTAGDQQQDPSMFDKLYQYAELVQAQPNLLRETITAENKELFRPLLQWIGGYMVKMVNPGVWYDEIVRRIQRSEAEGHDLAIVTGLRFPGDAERILSARGIIVRVIRNDAPDRDQTDPTEREQLTIPYQVTVHNNGSLAELAEAACRLHKDMSQGQMQVAYYAVEPSVV